MTELPGPHTRLAAARGTPAVLSAACDVFEHILLSLRTLEDHSGDLLPAIVTAAAAAADGRDVLMMLPGLLAASPVPAASLAALPLGAAATGLSELGEQLADYLQVAAGHPGYPAAARAADCARRIHLLLAPPAP